MQTVENSRRVIGKLAEQQARPSAPPPAVLRGPWRAEGKRGRVIKGTVVCNYRGADACCTPSVMLPGASYCLAQAESKPLLYSHPGLRDALPAPYLTLLEGCGCNTPVLCV